MGDYESAGMLFVEIRARSVEKSQISTWAVLGDFAFHDFRDFECFCEF